MNPEHSLSTGTLRTAGVLLIVGLLTVTISLAWTHPIAFLAFVGGAFIVLAGIVVYLVTLILPGSPVKGSSVQQNLAM